MTLIRRSAQPGVRDSAVYNALWLFCLSAMIFVSIYAASRELNLNASIFTLRFGFGPAIQGLIQQHRIGTPNETYGWWCYASRMPLIPILGAISYTLSPKVGAFLILKNLLFWPIWIYAYLRLKHYYDISNKWALVPLVVLLLSPHTLSTAGKIEGEEGFLFSLLGLLFSLLVTMGAKPFSAVPAAATAAAVYLTKSSMLPLTLVVALWICFKCRKDSAQSVLLPLAIIALAILSWGSYTKAESGVFAFGADSSSWNGWNLYKGNNPYAYALYPRVNLDVLDDEDYAHRLLPFAPVHNEWELSHAQVDLAQKYIRENPGLVLKMDLKKLFVACCDLGESPKIKAGPTRVGIIMSNAVSHIMVAFVVIAVAVNVFRRQVSEAEIVAVLLMCAYLLPYFAGFLYMRHLTPIYGVMVLASAIQLVNWQTRSLRLRVHSQALSSC